MIFDKMFTQGRILETALQATEYRNQVMINNIANAETPGFKGKTVEFENVLASAIEGFERTGQLSLENVMPIVKSQHGNYSVRLDKNNIDIETEMVKFYRNSAKYDNIVNSVLNNSTRLNSVFTGMK